MSEVAEELENRVTLPWAIALASLVFLGVALRLYAFDFPAGLIYDEVHFVENARNYLQHKADWNDHPPLGKLIIAASMQVLGDRAVAWRLPSLLYGLVTIVGGGLTAARLFRSWSAGAVAAALLSADGFLIAFSRIGVLDGALAASVVLCLFLATLKWSLRLGVAAGLLLGCAASFKFSGIGVAVPLLVSLLLSETPWPRKALLWLVVGTVAAFVYLGLYAAGLSLAGQPSGVAEAVRDSQRLLAHHTVLTEMKNPFVSSWTTWFLPTRPILMSRVDTLGQARVLTMLGNLATWWSAVLCAGAVSLAALLDLLKLRSTLLSSFVAGNRKAVFLLLSAALAFLAPWMLSNRDSYLYHFLPSYTALLLLLSGLIAWLRLQARRVALAFLCVVLVVAAIYAPVWSSMPVSPAGVSRRLFLAGWQ